MLIQRWMKKTALCHCCWTVVCLVLLLLCIWLMTLECNQWRNWTPLITLFLFKQIINFVAAGYPIPTWSSALLKSLFCTLRLWLKIMVSLFFNYRGVSCSRCKCEFRVIGPQVGQSTRYWRWGQKGQPMGRGEAKLYYGKTACVHSFMCVCAVPYCK